MEIHKIEICNLNSLKGEFCIDFMSGNLKGQDIFAITGATGSGKSTILDAITLALYNRVPRLDGKRGENSPKSQDPYKRLKPGDTENTLSRGEKKGYAKVVFEVGGQLYRGEWFCELKNLNFGGSHSLYRLKKEAGVEKAETLVSGNLVHEFDANGFPKDKTVSKMVVELIGLGYDQFCKACILAQNSFSNFLKANDFEKADILEKITGTSIYGRIADVIAKGYDDAYKEKKAIDDAISGQARIMLSDVDLAKFKAEKEELLQEQERLKRSISSMVAGISWWNDLGTLKEKLETAETNKRTAEEKEKEFLPDRKRLERHDKVEQGLELLGKEVDAQKDLDTADKGVVEAQKKLKENQEEIQNKEEKKAEAESVLREKQANLNRLASVKPIKENFSLIESEYQNLNRSIAGLKTAAQPLIPEKKDEGSLVKAVRQLTESVSRDLTMEAQQDNLNKIKRKLTVCSLSEELYPKIERILQLDADDKVDSQTIDAKIPQQQALGKDIDHLKSHIGALENENFTIKRGQLEEGKPCELCGAIHHPYATEAVFSEVIEGLKGQFREKKEEKEKVDNAITEAQKRISGREGERRALNGDIVKIKGKLVAADESFQTVFSKYAAEAQINELKTKAAEKEGLERELAEAENLYSLIGLRDLLSKVDSHIAILNKYLPKDWYSQRLSDKDHYAQTLNDLVKQYNRSEKDVENADRSVNGFKTAIETLTTLTPRLKEDIRNKESVLKEKKEPLAKAISALNDWIAAFNDENEDPVSREELAAQKEDKTDWVSLRKTITEALKKSVELRTLFQQAGASLKEHEEKEDRPTEDKETLEARKDTFVSQLEKGPDSVVERLKILLGRLATHDAAEKAIADVKDDLEKAEKKVNLWTRFYNILGKKAGDKDAKEFRKLAQNYTLGLLLSYANEELGKFTKRYTLKKQNDNSLEIMVLDGELGERYSSSLSGGETFMVSLALALGLSSISSGSVTLKNIFIDEGFGTLDSDTQKTVVAALNTLRTQGKRIGLISHTAALLSDDSIYKITVKKGDKFSVIDFG